MGENIATIKIIGYISIMAMFEYLDIIDTQFYILSILMIIDFFAGVAKQFVVNKKDITSKRAYIGIIKKIGVLLVFLSLALMFKGVGIDGASYLKAIISILIMAETYSIIQNTYTVRTGKETTEYDVISILLLKLGETIKSYLDKKL